MQATVESWDSDSGAVVCLDDGTRVRCPAEAIAAGGWRLLRSGQRVTLVVEGDLRSGGAVRLVTLGASQ